MRLRLLDRVRRSRQRRQAEKLGARERAGAAPGPAATSGTAGAHRRAGRAAPTGPGQAGSAGATGTGPRTPGPRPGSPAAPGAPGPATPPRGTRAVRAGQDTRQPGHALPRRWGIARAAVRAAPRAAASPRAAAAPEPVAKAQPARAAPRAPWYEIAQSNRTAVGRRHCGHLEELIHREWAENVVPSAEVVRAIDRLAELPQLIKVKLRAGLDAIYVGMGGVPDLDDMGRLKGVPLPSGRATWDACAGAYGERKVIVGSRPSPSPDVMCHEIGHALDDIDGEGEHWQSDSEEFLTLYEQCLQHMVSAFHRQPGVLGRREFFADAFAAIASRQRPALVEMLSGDTRAALNVMLYFNVRYGI